MTAPVEVKDDGTILYKGWIVAFLLAPSAHEDVITEFLDVLTKIEAPHE